MPDELQTSIPELLRLGHMGLDLGFRKDAEAYFDQVLTLAPGHPGALLGKAQACEDPEQALEYVRHVLAVRPGARQALKIEQDLLAKCSRSTITSIRPSATDAEPISAGEKGPPASPLRLKTAIAQVETNPYLKVLLRLVLPFRSWRGWVYSGLAMLAIYAVFLTWGAWWVNQSLNPATNKEAQYDTWPTSVTGIDVGAQVALTGAEKSVVQIVVLNKTSMQISVGSGSIVTEDGLVLTNYHVVATSEKDSLANEDGLVYVGLTDNPRQAPSEWFIGAVIASDIPRDLAVIRLLYTASGRAVRGRYFPPLPRGNAETLTLGESLIGLGYPSLGGETITLMRGAVAGFVRDENDVRLGKTDSELLPGSSGGAILNADGEMVGIITRVYSEERTQGRLSYFVLLSEASEILSQAQRVPQPRPNYEWMVELFPEIIH